MVRFESRNLLELQKVNCVKPIFSDGFLSRATFAGQPKNSGEHARRTCPVRSGLLWNVLNKIAYSSEPWEKPRILSITFYYTDTGCLFIRILILTFNNPHITGPYDPLYTLKNQGFLHCSTSSGTAVQPFLRIGMLGRSKGPENLNHGFTGFNRSIVNTP